MSPVQVVALLVSFALGALLTREIFLYRAFQARLREDREVAELETIFDREWSE